MLRLIFPLLFAVQGTSEAMPRDYRPTYRDLITINNDYYSTFRSQLAAYDGSSFANLQITQTLQTIDRDTNTTTSDVNLASNFNRTDAETLTGYIVNTLEPHINSSLADFILKKTQLAAGGLGPYLSNQLRRIQADTATLGNALVAKSPGGANPRIMFNFRKIDNGFNSAISASPSSRRAVKARDFPTLQSDFQMINANITALKTSNANWDGTINGWIPIQRSFLNIENNLNKTTTDINASPSLTGSQAQSIVDYLNNPVERNFSATVTAIISKKAQYTSARLQSTTCDDFKRLLNALNRLCPAYVSKNPSGLMSNAQTVCDKLKADIQRGVAAFCS